LRLLPVSLDATKRKPIKKTVVNTPNNNFVSICFFFRGTFDSAKNHKRQRRKRQSVTAKREKSQTPKFV